MCLILLFVCGLLSYFFFFFFRILYDSLDNFILLLLSFLSLVIYSLALYQLLDILQLALALLLYTISYYLHLQSKT